MKPHLHYLLLFLSLGISAQTSKPIPQKISSLVSKNVQFKKFNILNEVSQKNSAVENIVKTATLATIDQNSVETIYNQKNQTLEISIPYQGENIEIQLYRVNPLANSFSLETNKKSIVDYKPGVYYRGIIKNEANSLASFSFFKDKFSGIVSSNKFQNLNIGKLAKENNKTDYIVYSDANLKVKNNWVCETDEASELPDKPEHSSMYYEKSSVAEKCVAMYYEMDYDLFQANNSNIQETMDWMSAAFNNMQTLFENDDIRVSLYHVFIWESIDPYEGTGSSSSHLTAFYNNRPSIPGNMAQLVGLDGPLGGVTRQFALPCNGLGRSYASVDFDFQTVPTYSWNLNVMTHENGHAMGSRHTHACVWNGNGTAIDGCGPAAGYSEGCDGPIPPEGGTIMSYCHLNPVGMNFLLGFGPQPKTVIINNINAASCLSTDCNVCFDTMSDSSINVEEITKTSAKLSWKDPGKDAELWEYIVRKAQRSDPTGWIQTSTDKINLNNLEKNTYYEIFVRKICGGIGMASRHYMFATDGDFCNGDIFTDSGGVDKPFVPGDFIRTISPGNTGQKIKVNFSRLLLHPSYDHLYVYDGKDISAPQLADLTGIHEQANYSYTSTDLSGALTFRFVTKDTNPELDGWIANVECLENLATEDFDKYLDFSYYPNPILNQLNVNAKNEILEATVYNIEGRKLHSKKIKSKTTQLDFSKYPAGNYIVELKFKEKPVTLKVIKK